MRIEWVRKRAVKEICSSISGFDDISITLTVPPMPPLMNSRCHYNSLNEVKANRAVSILEVFNSTDATAHYICMNGNGKVYDPTLGWSWGGEKYKLVRIISASDPCLNDMGKELSNLKLKAYEMTSITTKILMAVFLMDRWDIC